VLPAQTEREIGSAPAAEQQVLELAVSNDSATTGSGDQTSSLTVHFKRVPIEVWVDPQGIVRQVRVTTPHIVHGAGPNQIIPVVVTLSYSDFGAAVAGGPPAAEVYVAPGAPRSWGGSAGS
jgi:hypothetical protein